MQTTLYISGMHCASCDLLIREAIASVGGAQVLELTAKGKLTVQVQDLGQIDQLKTAILAAGYGVSEERNVTKAQINRKEVGILVVVAILLWFGLNRLDLSNYAAQLGSDGSLGYGEMFLLGIVASLSTCLALVGGFVLMRGSLQGGSKESFRDALRHQGLFQLGRLGGYALGGALLGLIGSAIIFSPTVNGVINFLISALLLVMGRNMLGRRKIKIPTRGGGSRLMSILQHFAQKKWGGILVGALTFFLPCGFTQLAQINAMSTGSAVQGASLLFVFALGTLPVLLILGLTGNRLESQQRGIRHKLLGVFLIVLAIVLLPNAMRLLGW